MSHSVNVMPDSSSPVQSKPIILDVLPDLRVLSEECSPRTQQKIDLILLAIEALELGGSEYM